MVYKMVIHVKDAETDLLVRELARVRGVGITAAIREAAAEALSADRTERDRTDNRSLEERVQPLLDRLDRLPRSTIVTDKAFFDDQWGQQGE